MAASASRKDQILRNTLGSICFFLDFRGAFKTQSNIKDGAFCKNSHDRKLLAIFVKAPSDMFHWVLNTSLDLL